MGGDLAAVSDLSYAARRAFLGTHPLPAGLRRA